MPGPDMLPDEPETDDSPYVDDDDWQPSGGGFDYGSAPANPYDGGYSDKPAWTGQAPPAVAAPAETAVQWLVKFNNNGRQEELGAIDINATHDDIVERWFDVLHSGGRVLLYPLDNLGRVLTRYVDEPFPVDFNVAHDAIQRAKQRRAAGISHPSAPGGGAGMPGVDFNAFLRRQEERHAAELAMIREDIARREARAEEDRRIAADERRELSEQRAALAVTASQNTQANMEKVNDAMMNQFGGMMTMITGVMSSQQAQADAAHQRRIETMREEARQERERSDRDRQERERWESNRREEAMKAEMAREKQRENDRREREKWNTQAHERDLEAQRAHNAQTLELVKQRSENNDIGAQMQKMATLAMGLAGTVGFDIKEGLPALAAKLMGGGSGGGILDTVGDVAKTLASAAVEMKKLEAGDSGEEEMIIVQTPQGPMQMTQGQLAAFQQQMAVVMQQEQQQQLQLEANEQARHPVPDLPGLVPWPGQNQPQPPDLMSQPSAVPPPQQHVPPAVQQQAQQPVPQQVPNPATQQPMALPPRAQKLARRAARDIVAAVMAVAPAERQGTFTTKLIEHQAAIEPYLQFVPVSHALREAGAPEELITEICTALQQSGMLPPHIQL